jgi:ketosteroid isomerase-like protein
LDLVRSIYADWERGDFSRADWADAEIEYMAADGPEPGTWEGLAGIAKVNRDWLNAWAEIRIVAEEFRELDNERVFVLSRGSGLGKTSGLDIADLSTEAAQLFHIQDGRIMRLVVYFDRDRALADLGLKE